MKIEDNFLDQEKFDEIQTLMISQKFPWFYNDYIVYEEEVEKFQFIHGFYNDYVPVDPHIEILNPIFEIIKATAMIRIKANLLTRTPKIVENAYHHDISNYDDENRKTIFPEKLKQTTTSIFYVNTNNGYTEFEDDTRVEAVANRMVTFSSNLKHRGTSCTDEKIKIVINFNYFK